MCQSLEILLVCCSIVCPQEQHRIRLPLLRLVPKPDAAYLLCDKALQLGYRHNANFVGIPVLSLRPEACPDFPALKDSKYEVCVSPAASRQIMQSAAELQVHCGACLGMGHAAFIDPRNDAPRLARRLQSQSDAAVAGNLSRIESAWTCCAFRNCDQDNLCAFRAAAVVSAIQDREALVALAKERRAAADAAVAVEMAAAANALLDLADQQRGGQSDTEVEDDDDLTIVFMGDCPGCEKCNFGRSARD